jgi:transposase, IS5 family
LGYKGDIGIDAESKIIRKRSFTTANVHNSVEIENVLSGDEKSIGQIKPIPNKKIKKQPGLWIFSMGYWAKEQGVENYRQEKKRNKQKSSVRAAVEYPFAFTDKKLKVAVLAAKPK